MVIPIYKVLPYFVIIVMYKVHSKSRDHTKRRSGLQKQVEWPHLIRGFTVYFCNMKNIIVSCLFTGHACITIMQPSYMELSRLWVCLIKDWELP